MSQCPAYCPLLNKNFFPGSNTVSKQSLFHDEYKRILVLLYGYGMVSKGFISDVWKQCARCLSLFCFSVCARIMEAACEWALGTDGEGTRLHVLRP